MGAGEGGDRGALVGVGGPDVFEVGAGEGGWASAVAFFGLGGGDALNGEFVLDVALELADGGDDVDQKFGGGVRMAVKVPWVPAARSSSGSSAGGAG